jgi:hypothetical protein
MATFGPIQNSGAKRPEQQHIIGDKRQADWKHPESNDWQEAKGPAKRQQYPLLESSASDRMAAVGNELPSESRSAADL